MTRKPVPPSAGGLHESTELAKTPVPHSADSIKPCQALCAIREAKALLRCLEPETTN